jgi:hypothetical protein
MYEYAPTDSEGYFTQLGEFQEASEVGSPVLPFDSGSSGDGDEHSSSGESVGTRRASEKKKKKKKQHDPHAHLHAQSGSTGLSGSTTTIRDWNEEFQCLMEKKDSEAKFTALSSLAKDFIYISEVS